MPRGTPRLGLTGTIAVVSMVGLLAAGFGMLGGRPDASPDGRASATSPSPTPAPTPPRVVHVGPQVTPWTECGQPPVTPPPSIELQVNGTSFGAVIEEMDLGFFGMSGGPMRGLPDHGGQRIDVPADLVSELWIDQGVCAIAWSIDLVHDTHGQIPVDFQGNPDRDPSLATQNRFALELYPYAEGDYILVAVFDLGTAVVRASWAIHVPPVDVPTAILLTADGPVPVVMGCDVTLTLGTRLTQDLNPCADDVGDPPTETAALEAGEIIEFRLAGFGGTWQIDDAGGLCGRLVGPSFFAEEECLTRVVPAATGTVQFAAPRRDGRWIVALSACGSAVASRPPGRNSICGTWYASIGVRA